MEYLHLLQKTYFSFKQESRESPSLRDIFISEFEDTNVVQNLDQRY